MPHGDEGILGTAMQGSSFWSRLTFSWVDPLLQKGRNIIMNNMYVIFTDPHICDINRLIDMFVIICCIIF